jgi:glycosyltransferase involved in cell wall biosynthesis
MSEAEHNRILMLLENNVYPFDSRVRQEAQALVSAGFGVTVISPGRSGLPFHENLAGVSVYRFPSLYWSGGTVAYLWEYSYSLFMLAVLSAWVWFREGFSVIHAHNPPDILCLVGLMFRVTGKKFVFDHHDLSPEIWEVRSRSKNGLMYRVLQFFERLSCQIADRVITTNESYRRLDNERNGVPLDRIVTVRNGPDPRRVRPIPAKPELVAEGRPIVGYVGTIGPQDGLDYLLRAAHIVRNVHERPDVLFLIVGDGDSLPGLKSLCTELGLDGQVQFTGRLHDDNLISHLCAATICVDPDPANALNVHSTMIKIPEYMALGKPIVAFDLHEHHESAAGAALYVEPNDEAKFAAAICELLEDPGKRARMGAIGMQRVRESLAWSYSAENLVSMYRDLLEPARQAASAAVARQS